MILEQKSSNISFGYDEIKGIFTGYASVFNEVDRVGDTVHPNAYDKEIKAWEEGKSIPANFEHEKTIIVAGNLNKMEVDQKGLLVQFQFSEEAKSLYPQIWQWAVEKAKAGKLFMSIGFESKSSLLGSQRIKLKKQMIPDTIMEIELDHIAITDNPVDTKAKVLEVKSMEPNYNSMIKELNGKISAKRFLKENKSLLSNTNIENFVDQIFNMKFETEEKSLPKEVPVIVDTNNDLDAVLGQVFTKLNYK